MIDKKSSNEMNDILNTAQESIKNIKEDLDAIDTDMQKKFLIMKNEQDFALDRMATIKTLLTDTGNFDCSNKIVFGNLDMISPGGVYDMYGCCVHPKLKDTPVNIFNFMTAEGPYFKNNAVVKVNDTINLSAKECLKHDSVSDKSIYFEEYNTDTLTFEVLVDTGKLVGDTKTNMIELAPFIAGSFEITDVSILTKEGQITGLTGATTVMTNLGEIGYTRIMLDQTYNIYKIVLTIKILYKNANGKYPFGLRHLYFYNATYTANSYIIAEIIKDKYIDSVGDDIIVTDQNSKITKSAADCGIELYLNCDGGVLSNGLDLSTNSITNSWARETKTFYAKIPVNSSLYALQFLSINTR